MPNVHLSTEDMIKMTPNVFGNVEIKQENVKDTRDDSSRPSDSQDDAGTEYFIKLEPDVDNAMPNFEEVPLMKDDHVESSDAEDIISLAVVKEEPSDVTGNTSTCSDSQDYAGTEYFIKLEPDVENAMPNTRDDSSTSSNSQDDAGTEYFIKLEPDVDHAMPNFEEVPLMKDDHVESSDAEDIISLAVIKEEPSDVTGNDAAVEQNDADLYHSALGLHTECDIPLDIVKEEPGDVDTVFKMGKTNAEHCKNYYNRKKAAKEAEKIRQGFSVEKPIKKTGAERTRAYRLRKIMLSQANESSVTDISSIPSTSNSRIRTFEPSFQLATTSVSTNRPDVSTVSSTGIADHDGVPRLAAQKYRNDTLLSNLKRADQTIEKVKEPKRETGRDIEDEPVSHIRSNTCDKTYECSLCKKCFNRWSHLNVHMRVHTGEKPYECNVCNKCFNLKSNLDRHFRTHTGEKPHKCNECKKCFNNSGQLNVHMRIHTGEKPYECNVCNKCFNEKGKLNTHMLTHTGEKPYACNVCKKCFNLRSNLQKHVRKHTGEKRYECNLCKKCFHERSQLNIHMRVHTKKV